jgi:hypothetical protein
MKFPSYRAAAVLTVCLMSAPALANSAGITGYSGKSSAVTCTSCHVAGAATRPTVEISGPTTLDAGATGNYTFIIRGGPGVKAGFDVSVDNAAASLTAGTGSKKVGSELTHSAPKAFSGGEVRFDFSLVAPADGGTVMIFGAGNSVNGDGVENKVGDSSATTSLSVLVNAPASTPSTNEDEGGGCSSTGGAPVLLLSLLAGGMTLLRRRRA